LDSIASNDNEVVVVVDGINVVENAVDVDGGMGERELVGTEELCINVAVVGAVGCSVVVILVLGIVGGGVVIADSAVRDVVGAGEVSGTGVGMGVGAVVGGLAAVQVATGRLVQEHWEGVVKQSCDSGENRQRHNKHPLTKHVHWKSLQTE
jgi:hypothetical protein